MKAMRRLRMACPSPDGLLPSEVSDRLFVTSSGANQDFELTDPQKRAASVGWYAQPMGRFLLNDVLVCGVRDRLGLAQFPQPTTCQYTARSSQRLCAAPVDVRGDRCSKCCHALSQARHHVLRDWIKAQLNACGEHAAVEQTVLTKAGPQGAGADDTGDLWHRADVVSIDAAGCRTFCDVAVVSTPVGGCARQDAQKVTCAKLATYGASTTNPVNVHGDLVQPCHSRVGTHNTGLLLASGSFTGASANTDAEWFD